MLKTILLIEDEPKNMELATDLLEANGYGIIQAWNGQEGIDTAKTKLPDLILTDIQMPVKNGLDVATELKADATTAPIPLIALTSEAMSGDKEKALNAGCDDYMSKPINLKGLLGIVKKYLDS